MLRKVALKPHPAQTHLIMKTSIISKPLTGIPTSDSKDNYAAADVEGGSFKTSASALLLLIKESSLLSSAQPRGLEPPVDIANSTRFIRSTQIERVCV